MSYHSHRSGDGRRHRLHPAARLADDGLPVYADPRDAQLELFA